MLTVALSAIGGFLITFSLMSAIGSIPALGVSLGVAILACGVNAGARR